MVSVLKSDDIRAAQRVGRVTLNTPVNAEWVYPGLDDAVVGNFSWTNAAAHTWDGDVSYKLKQFAKGYSRFSMGVSSENKVQLFPNLPQEVCFGLKWN